LPYRPPALDGFLVRQRHRWRSPPPQGGNRHRWHLRTGQIGNGSGRHPAPTGPGLSEPAFLFRPPAV